jgi:1-acyl-sn-glycerol-3-phosphate acyltransferase
VLYDVVAGLLRPSTWWGRVRVEGLEAVPTEGPLLVVPNHDSQWDPIVVGLAIKARRRLRFLARASLFRIPGVGPVLRGIGQIPIERSAGDARAMGWAVDALRDGEAICIFPEGGLSWGERVRARSGVGRLAQACPGARIVLCAVAGAEDYARFPRRPRVRVSFFEPAGGQPRTDEEPVALAARLLDELRERTPPVPAGRRPQKAARKRAERAEREVATRASRS